MTTAALPDIARRFARSGPTYSQSALVQRAMAEQLVGLILRHRPDGPLSAWEIGCGTGHLTERLLDLPGLSQLTLNDLYCHPPLWQTVQLAVPGAEFRLGDAQSLAWPQAVDLIAANAVFQWFDHHPTILERAWQNLAPGGLLAFSTFLPDHFHESRTAGAPGLTYHPTSTWRGWLAAGWRVLAEPIGRQVLDFPDALAVLRHIRQTGVGAARPAAWTTADTRAWLRAYPLTAGGTCPLSYSYQLFLVQKVDR